MADSTSPTAPARRKRFGALQVLGIVLLVVVLTAAGTAWYVKTRLFPSEFRPVELSVSEERELAEKMGALEPEAYRESDADRVVRFTERELNALLANNTDLASRVAIDLSDDLISAKVLVPMDEDFPVIGGKTLRVKAGVEFAYDGDRPVVRLKGITVMGVPVPNAWLGGIKNVDLVDQYGGSAGFWHLFAEGVADVRAEEGGLTVRLKE